MRRFATYALGIALAATGPVAAQGTVPEAFRRTAELYDLPDDRILYAIAMAESGRAVDGAVEPWPWTLNVAGKGYYYPDQAAAWEAIGTFIAEGHTSIDVGLMQVNYRWHQADMVDPYTALDPDVNIALAARILAEELAAVGDLEAAVGRYHSPGPSEAQQARAERYRKRVVAFRARLDGSAP